MELDSDSDICLRSALDELPRQKGEPLDSENNKILLERIVSLETIREKNSQQLMAKDEEIASLRNQLYMKWNESDAHLQEQIDYYVKEKEQRENLIQSLQTETEEVKNTLVTISMRCQDLESRVAGQDSNSDGQGCTTDAAALQSHLRHALEKNQQWLAYNEQREAYVKAALARMSWLEQQLNQASQALIEPHNEVYSDARNAISQMQEYYDRLLLKAKNELEELREQVDTALRDLHEMRCRCEEMEREAAELQQKLQAERMSSRNSLEKHCSDRESRVRAEMKELQGMLDEEKRRSAELLLQVNLLRKSTLNHREDQKKIAILEQQIQVSSKDLEDEKRDCLHLQKQLHRVLKELHKTRDPVTKRSEREPRDTNLYEASSHSRVLPCKPSKESVMSPPRIPNLQDESFLECPGCQAQYPSSQHRELLAHLDHCLN
ncbi:centrosomal protein of 55 kDa-like [Polymixia lowei]